MRGVIVVGVVVDGLGYDAVPAGAAGLRFSGFLGSSGQRVGG